MPGTNRALTGLVLAIPSLLAGPRAWAVDGTSLEMWVRAKGQHGGARSPKRSDRKTILLGQLPQQTVARMDYQYAKSMRYRGVSLAQIVEAYGKLGRNDLALLHFSNKMIVPVPLGSGHRPTLDVFVALARWDKAKKRWLTNFPQLARKPAYRDARPIPFVGNKVVVQSGAHPMLAKTAKGFSPWRHVASLVGIEFVQRGPYYAQFDVGKRNTARQGWRRFQENCQFCHGVNKVGAGLGWDFVRPYPMYKWRKDPKNLFYHVRYRVHEAAQRGWLMPALKHMSESEAAQVWAWLKAVGKAAIRPYQPK